MKCSSIGYTSGQGCTETGVQWINTVAARLILENRVKNLPYFRYFSKTPCLLPSVMEAKTDGSTDLNIGKKLSYQSLQWYLNTHY